MALRPVVTYGSLNSRLNRIYQIVRKNGLIVSGIKYPIDKNRYFGIIADQRHGLCLVAVTHSMQSLHEVIVRDGQARNSTNDVGGLFKVKNPAVSENWDNALRKKCEDEFGNMVSYFYNHEFTETK